MTKRLRIRLDRRGARYRHGGGRSVDVFIAGRRIWSLTLNDEAARLRAWPEALLSRLQGTAVCEVRCSADGARLWSGVVRWGGSGEPDLVDALGRDVVVNKWGRLSHSFAGEGDDVQRQIMSLAERVIAALDALGFPAFVVGGTLLGAARGGSLLPHDDDADIAYLSEHSHPSDLVIESARIERALQFEGFRVIRHSWAHLQLAEVAATGHTKFYVDVFTAFCKDGEFCEPIHMRGPADEVQILPLSTVTIGDREYPAPASPESWLRACYGPKWRTPDPGFSFETARDTVRRFNGWFGHFNLHRWTWEDAYLADASLGADVPITAFEELLLEELGGSGSVIDLGAGSGRGALRMQELGYAVRCLDYAWSAPCHVETALSSQVVNLNNYSEAVPALRSTLAELRRTVGTGGTTIAWANRLLAGNDPRNRAEMLTVFGFLLRAGVRVFTCDYETLGDYAFDRPTSWHLPEVDLREECAARGLRVERIASATVGDDRGVHREAGMYEVLLTGRTMMTSNDGDDL